MDRGLNLGPYRTAHRSKSHCYQGSITIQLHIVHQAQLGNGYSNLWIRNCANFFPDLVDSLRLTTGGGRP